MPISLRRLLALLLTLCLAACGGSDGDNSISAQCSTQREHTPESLSACITEENVLSHLVALSDIAAANGGNRASGSAGFNAALDYARKVFLDAGYTVSVQPFSVRHFRVLSPGELVLTSASPEAIENMVFYRSGSGDVTARVDVPTVPIGCLAADFANFVPGRLALIQRGDCSFQEKAQNAAQAGASGVVVYNNTEGTLQGGLFSDTPMQLPVVGITREMGQRLLAMVPQGLSLRLKVQTLNEQLTTFNLLAESKTGSDEAVVMLGAHLDTAEEAAGINDNGSGVAAVLETARQMAHIQTQNKVRFALWGAEESGLEGSVHYLQTLTPAEKARIALYLNLDMLASHNGGYFILDSDGSASPDGVPGAPGATQIEEALGRYYSHRSIPIQSVPVHGYSDHWSFFAAGLPVGGIETGASEVKTEEEARIWGGTANQAYDSCYHEACDNLANLNTQLLLTNTRAAAWAMLSLASPPRVAAAASIQRHPRKALATVPPKAPFRSSYGSSH